MIDRIVKKLTRRLSQVPVGFKWFAEGLCDCSYSFGGGESAGSSFLRFDSSVWATDKDGLIIDLLVAKITARTSKDPDEHYRELTAESGTEEMLHSSTFRRLRDVTHSLLRRQLQD